MKRALGSLLALLLVFTITPAWAGVPLEYRFETRQSRGPGYDAFKWHALARDRAELHAAWERYGLRGTPPHIGFSRRIAVFAGTGGSSSCPPSLGRISLNREERRIAVRIRIGVEGDGACTDDWVPNTFLVSLRRSDLPRGDLRVRVYRVDW